MQSAAADHRASDEVLKWLLIHVGMNTMTVFLLLFHHAEIDENFIGKSTFVRKRTVRISKANNDWAWSALVNRQPDFVMPWIHHNNLIVKYVGP